MQQNFNKIYYMLLINFIEGAALKNYFSEEYLKEEYDYERKKNEVYKLHWIWLNGYNRIWRLYIN